MISGDKTRENSFEFPSHNKLKMFKKKPRKKLLETKEIQKLINAYEEIDAATIKNFTDFPLSQKTQKGLKDAKYERPTDIQRESIGIALKGRDVLGAAKTGSGKTVAFLVPLLERLYLERWTTYDGLGALVITPTRELAYQIFEVLRKIGSYHEFSAGLIIGGKDLKFERKRMDKCNIVICTPGRILQHMDENPLFDCTNLRLLVLDEADRILDLGFEKTVNSIIENLPQERQTLLFSATQTRSVKDLARLSLHHPVYISVHEYAAHRTPEGLQQSYLVCESHDKLNLLWSFLKTHLKQKILIFMASCKQVKYAYESFCRMQPGMSILALYGSLHQLRRMAIYDEFCRKQHAVLFATDIAARGLDFPAVNWVVQLDCPEDVKTYIHRVGRTARYEGNGEALLVLLPSEEESMIRQLTEDKIPINQIFVNKKKFLSVQRKLEALCCRDHILKESAQRAFVSYLKSVFLMKDKSVFKTKEINTDAFARSLGLAVTPRIRFLSRQQKLQAAASNKNKLDTAERMQELKLNSDADELDDDNGQGHHTEDEDSPPKPTSQIPFDFHDSDDDSEEEFLVAKTSNSYHDKFFKNDENYEKELEESHEEKLMKAKQRAVTKAAMVKKMLKKNVKANNKLIFDEEGKPVEKFPTKQTSHVALELSRKEQSFNIQTAKLIMEEEDKIDKQLFRQRIKALHKEKKAKLREGRKHKEREAKSEKEQDASSASDDETLNEYVEQLPDPDKVYNKEEIDKESRSSQGSDEETRVSKKKKANRKRSKESEDDENTLGRTKPPKLKKRKVKSVLDTNLELMEDEELALHLLSQQ